MRLTRVQIEEHLRVDSTDDATLIDLLIETSREWIESYTGHVFTAADKTFRFRSFGSRMVISSKPLNEVTAINYEDPDGVSQTYDNSRIVRQEVIPARNEVFPATDPETEIVVTANVGYEAEDPFPALLSQAQLLLIGHLYENREQVITGTIATELPFGIKTLLAPYRDELP